MVPCIISITLSINVRLSEFLKKTVANGDSITFQEPVQKSSTVTYGQYSVLYKKVLGFKSVDEILKCNIEMKTTERFFFFFGGGGVFCYAFGSFRCSVLMR